MYVYHSQEELPALRPGFRLNYHNANSITLTATNKLGQPEGPPLVEFSECPEDRYPDDPEGNSTLPPWPLATPSPKAFEKYAREHGAWPEGLDLSKPESEWF